jgi:hypothetical protein
LINEKYYFVSHGYLGGGRADWDSIGSLAALVRFAKINNLEYRNDYDIIMIDYFKDGLNHISGITNSVIIVADIPPEFLIQFHTKEGFKNLLYQIKNNYNKLIFIDHHPNSDDVSGFMKYLEGKGLFYELDFFDVSLENDKFIPLEEKLCAAERVQKFLFKHYKVSDDDVFQKVRKYAHDQDFGIRKIQEALNITIVIGANFNNEKLIFLIAEGIFWTKELQMILEEQNRLVEELYGKLKFKKITTYFKLNSHPIRKNIMYALMPEDKRLKTSAAAYWIFKRQNCDIVILLQRYPFISIRCPIYEKDISAAKIANIFGGGGHVGAASANKRHYTKWFPYRKIYDSNFEKIAYKINDIIVNQYKSA